MSDNILDLSEMKPNCEKDGKRYKIFKIDYDVYACYHVYEHGAITFTGHLSEEELQSYTPIPNAPQWVTLTTTTGEKVQLQVVWTHCHISHIGGCVEKNQKIMALKKSFGSYLVFFGTTGEWIEMSEGIFSQDYTPIAPTPTPLDEARGKVKSALQVFNDFLYNRIPDEIVVHKHTIGSIHDTLLEALSLLDKEVNHESQR